MGETHMSSRRTDLALEARELWQESSRETTALPGVRAREGQREDVPGNVVDILDEEGARALGKPRGRYVTLTLDGALHRAEGSFSRTVRALAGELAILLERVPEDALVLVAGLGNRSITPDAVGPLVHESVLVTRHLVDQVPEHFGWMRPVASLAAEVLGSTGVESSEVVRAVCEKLHPACVIAVDALASRSVRRLCRTVQLTDTGIAPGSGVGNHRQPLDRASLGIPVIAVGVPTVVEASTLAADLLGEGGDLSQLGPEGSLLVTPKDIDSQVAGLSKIIGYGISLALQPGLSIEDLDLLLS